MSSNKDDIFGGFFDFNGDGKTDIGEEWVAYKIMEECMQDDEDENEDEDDIFNISFDGQTYESVPSTVICDEAISTPLPEIYTKEELKAHCGSRKATIIISIIAAAVMLAPAIIIVWAAYASYDSSNSASGFLCLLLTIVGIFVGGAIVYSACKEITKAYSEIIQLKESFKRNNQEQGRYSISWSGKIIVGVLVAFFIVLGIIKIPGDQNIQHHNEPYYEQTSNYDNADDLPIKKPAMSKEEADSLRGTGYHNTRPGSVAEDIELKAAQVKCKKCGYHSDNGYNSYCDSCQKEAYE